MLDSTTIFRLYVPIGMLITLMVMAYFHWHHRLKYLYLSNSFCILLTLVAYFILLQRTVGYDDPRLWMQAMPFIWIFGILMAYSLFVPSVALFVIEEAKSHVWAKIVLKIACVVIVLCGLVFAYYFLQGLASLKSG